MKNMYSIPGKEYQFFIEGNGALKLTTSDIPDTKISGSTLQLPVGYQISDFKASIHSTVTAAKDINLTLHFYADGSQGVTLPAAGDFDHMYLYVYAEKVA